MQRELQAWRSAVWRVGGRLRAGLAGFHPTGLGRWLARPKTAVLVAACSVGLVAGLAAVGLKWGAATLGGQRLALALAVPGHWADAPWRGVSLPLLGGLACWLAGWLVQRFSPEAEGSGIPQVKAALAFAPMALNGRVALVKWAATSLTLGAGLTLGRQGPTVQLGAAIAAELSRWIPTSPAYRRQAIAAGAGAGLAAGFNAPIAGVLFVVEELLRDLSGLTLGPALLACFVGAVVAGNLGGAALPVNLNLGGAATGFHTQEIPAYLLLGLLAGWLGANFTRGVMAAQRLYGRLAWGLPGRMAIAGILSGLGVALLPDKFWNHSWLREELILGDLGWQWTALIFGAHFVLTLVAVGSGAPGGLFSPSLMLGASLGALVGFAAGSGEVATYALVGMGAFFCAVSRVPMTAIAIVFEMTRDFNLVLPLMVTATTAYLVADRLDPLSLYDRLLARWGLPSEPGAAQDLLGDLTAKDVMHQPVATLEVNQSLAEVRQCFANSHHRGFPVLERGRLVGIVTRSDLSQGNRDIPAEGLRHRHSGSLRQIMTPRPLTVQIDDSLADVRFLLSHYHISRLPVLEGQRLVGIVTRSDLLQAESQRLGGGLPGPSAPPLSYGVYKWRSPNLGRGRILLPLANPATAGSLLGLGLDLARQRQAELEALQVLRVEGDRRPAEMSLPPEALAHSRAFLDAVMALGEAAQVPLHVQLRAGHDVAQAILETIERRRIDCLLMGWQGHSSPPDRLLGKTLDRLLRDCPCETILVRVGTAAAADWGGGLALPGPLDRWLVPVGGGPHLQGALDLLPAFLANCAQPHLTLCHVLSPTAALGPEVSAVLGRAAQRLRDRGLTCAIDTVVPRAESIPEAILDVAAARRSQAILLGASREPWLHQIWLGNLAEAIARDFGGAIVVVRGPLDGGTAPSGGDRG